jgi:DNA modification methylase
VDSRPATWQILTGDCRDSLASLDADCVQTCVTSPPYFGLRDYGHDGQIGLEPTPDEFVAALVGVFREVRRVLRDDGTCWVNLGDSYGQEKQLLGVPWRFAFAMQQQGWTLRSDVIWHKPSAMPESATDRPTRAHEYLFLLSKAPRYFYDAEAIQEDGAESSQARAGIPRKVSPKDSKGPGNAPRDPRGPLEVGSVIGEYGGRRNKRTVWTVAAQPYAGAHFATFPTKLIEPCILAGSRPGDVVLDPFAGSGTTGMVALRYGRSFVGCELNPEYADLARDRIIADAPLLNTYAEAA